MGRGEKVLKKLIVVYIQKGLTLRYTAQALNLFKGAFGSCKMFSGKYIFSRNANFRKRKMYSDCLTVSEIVFRKINFGVWFVQTFYGNRFMENQFRCLVRLNILRKIPYGNHFMENHFRCLVCGSFYGKYEMCYKFKHLHYLDKPVTVQN